MEEKIYYMHDDIAEANDDCSFYLKTNCPQEELEEIVAQSYFICNDFEEEEIAEEYKKYIPNLYGWSKFEIIRYIVEDKGYTWEEVKFTRIDW